MVKINLVRQWKASGMPAAHFERVKRLPATSICKWKSLLPQLQRSDPAGFCAKAAEHPELEAKLMEWLLERWSWKGFRISTRMMQEQTGGSAPAPSASPSPPPPPAANKGPGW